MALLAVAGMLTSCLREEIFDNTIEVYQGDGKEVSISFNFGSSQAVSVTKILSDESERQVNDIMVFAFPIDRIDANGDPIFSTTRRVIKHYYSADDIRAAYAQEFHYNAGAIALDGVPTGTYAMIGVANVKTSEYGAERLYEELLKINSWEEYCNLRASLTSRGSIERVAPALLMSGSYRPLDYAGDHRKLTPVEIRNTGSLPGYIHLVRVDARVKFVITNAIDRVKSFTLESWQVFNVADDVKLYHNSESTPQTTTNSSVFTQFTSREKEHSFEFYVPEYIFTSADNTLDKIRLREKRNDADDAWVYAPDNSPYVVFTGKMEMLVDDAETGETDVNRYASVKFTVHLGACDGATEAEKSKDFKTSRNTKYTYNVRIGGVNDVVVEAKREEDVEYNHGTEGVVIDNVGGVNFNFDSHYAVANIMLSENDLKKMSIQLTSVLGEQHFNRDNNGNIISDNLDIESEDFQAYRFAFEPVSSRHLYETFPTNEIYRDRYVSYSKTYDAGQYIRVLHNEVAQARDENHTRPLYDLKSMLEGVPFKSDQNCVFNVFDARAWIRQNVPGYSDIAKEDIPVIFTMFVNENVYYKDGGDWHTHANSIDRVLRMFTTSDISSDGKSEYIRGRYIFIQKPCQTYYSDLNNEALCVEYVNEHHHKDIKNTKGVDAGGGGSKKSGWPYVNSELQGKRWDDCSDQTMPLCDHYNAFSTLAATNGVYAKQIPGSTDSNDYEAIYASLSRNRDLNRDGVIDSKEIKWFLASMEQYVQITIGGAALEKKLFAPDDYNNWNEAVDGPKGDIFGNVRFHFCGVETHSKFWAEEGYTIGDQWVNGAAESTSGWRSNPWELLCVRMLVDRSRVNEEEVHWSDFDDLYYFSNREKNVISMDLYRSNLHRQPVTSWIDIHTSDNDIANSTFTHFQFAKNDASLVDRNPGELVLVDRMHLNTYCANYSQESDGSDRGTWRVPNQRETVVIRYLAGINNATNPNGGAYYLSCSTWPFQSSGQRTNQGYRETIDFCTIGMNPTKSSPNGQLSQNNLRVRCVRDTDSEGNFVGTPEYEYGSLLDFQPGEFTCEYTGGDFANYTMNATMNASVVASVRVTFDDDLASVSGSGSVTASFNGAEVTKSVVIATWTIVTKDNKTLTYRVPCQLPARYWLISRYGVNNRYATINQDNDQTRIGATDNRPVDDIEAIFKWIITKDASGTVPVNVSDLVVGDTYYVFNAGTHQYISGPTSGSERFMTVGGTPMTMQLQTRNGYDGYYVLRFNNATNANSNGGADNFGTWTGVDDGSTYKLTPAVMRGDIPFRFAATSFTTDYDETDGTLADFTSDATFASEKSELVSVSINGTAVANPVVNGDNIHAVLDNALIPENGIAEVVWTFAYDGETITRTRIYNLPVRFYLMKSILSSNSYGYQYVYVDEEGNTRSTTFTSDLDKSLAPWEYRWVLSGDTPSPTKNILPTELVVNGNRNLYLYNQLAQAYITKPSPVSNFTDFLPTGSAAHRFCFDASKNGGFRPYFKWDGTNTYGSAAGSDRNPDKNKFGFSQAGVDAAYWEFIPVYIDNVQDKPLYFSFGDISETADGFIVTATMDADASIKSVTFDGVPVDEYSKVAADASASLSTASLVNPYGFTATWTIVKNGQEYVKSKYYVAKNTPFWVFRSNENNKANLAVSAVDDLTKFVSHPQSGDGTLPDESRWVLMKAAGDDYTMQAPVVPTNGNYLADQYVLFNIGTGKYLGGPAGNSVTANNLTLVDDRSQALPFYLGGNQYGKLIKFTYNGRDYFAYQKSDDNFGFSDGLYHSWKFYPYPLVTTIAISETTAALNVNGTLDLTATVGPSDAVYKEVTWSSNNSNVTVDESGKVTGKAMGTAIITATATDGSGVTGTCTVTVLPAGALTRKFTVNSSGKKVYFSKGNLYWDGSAFKFETNQYDFPTEWNTKHIGHFFWSKTASEAYSDYFFPSNPSSKDVFFTNSTLTTAKSDFTVNGVKGLYRTLSSEEWEYLLNGRTVNGGKGKGKSYSLDITYGGKKGLVLYPDDYAGSVLSGTVTTIPDGIVFLPAAMCRYGEEIYAENCGFYWSSSPDSSSAYELYFYGTSASVTSTERYTDGLSVRLVTDVK